VKTGQKIALVGASGAGKTTITALLFRFYEPDSGTIYLDDIPAKKISLNCLRKQMAIVPQEVLLFGGTIYENIAYGNTEATALQVEEAALKANALEFINSFPDGFQTIVGERGVQLSGGQKQRIAIARAILRDPKILVLDEATSALDTASESQVQQALNTLMIGRTSIIIAHRLSTIREADRILVIDKGKIVESGSHEELLARDNGKYLALQQMAV
jgi:ATP-binding cassette subfamily B protein